jgi:hypothetical protein
MLKDNSQTARWFQESKILMAWVLVIALTTSLTSVRGQAETDIHAYDLAIKTVRELGGKLRYADEFTSSKHVVCGSYNENPLDEYIDMKCPGRTVPPRAAEPSGTAREGGLREVVQIDLSGTQPVDEEIARLAAFPQLRVLLLNSTLLGDESLRHLAPLRQLEVLDLSSTRVTGAGLRRLAAIPRLTELHLIETKVDDEGLHWLAGMKNLEELSLSGSRVGDRGLEFLAANPKLRVLRIGRAAATEEGVKRFRHVHPKCCVFHSNWLDPLEPSPVTPDSQSGDLISRAPDEDLLPLSPDPFSEPRPWVSRLLEWNGRVVAECCVPGPTESKELHPRKEKRLLFSIDVTKAQSTPLPLPEADEVLGPAPVGQSELVVLCTQKGKRALFSNTNGVWTACPLPGLQSPILAMEGDRRDLVLLTPDEYLWRKDGQWSVRKHTGGDSFLKSPGLATFRHILADGSLYRAIAPGKFGGGLYRLDLSTGAWISAGPDRTDVPINDVKVDPQGRLWAVEGLQHLSLIKGAVSVRQTDGWKAMVSVDHSQRRKIGWNLGYTEFRAVAFDADGGIYVTSSDYGICRYEGRRWKPLFRPWPGDGQSSLHLVGSKIAVVGTYAGSVFLCRLDTGATRKVILVRPDASREEGRPSR